jgi:hypothetical protein
MGLIGSNWDFRWRYGLLGQPGGQAIEPFLGTRARKLLVALRDPWLMFICIVELGFIATIIVQSIMYVQTRGQVAQS